MGQVCPVWLRQVTRGLVAQCTSHAHPWALMICTDVTHELPSSEPLTNARIQGAQQSSGLCSTTCQLAAETAPSRWSCKSSGPQLRPLPLLALGLSLGPPLLSESLPPAVFMPLSFGPRLLGAGIILLITVCQISQIWSLLKKRTRKEITLDFYPSWAPGKESRVLVPLLAPCLSQVIQRQAWLVLSREDGSGPPTCLTKEGSWRRPWE